MPDKRKYTGRSEYQNEASETYSSGCSGFVWAIEMVCQVELSL